MESGVEGQGTTQSAPIIIQVRDDGGLSQNDGCGHGRGGLSCHLFGRQSTQGLLKERQEYPSNPGKPDKGGKLRVRKGSGVQNCRPGAGRQGSHKRGFLTGNSARGARP